MAMIAHPHIRPDARGVAWIDDANVKVAESPLLARLKARGLLS